MSSLPNDIGDTLRRGVAIPAHPLALDANRKLDERRQRVIGESGAEILVNYMPVGAQKATEAYAQACLDAGVSLVNCVVSVQPPEPSVEGAHSSSRKYTLGTRLLQTKK